MVETDFVTIEPVPIIAPRPMVTPRKIVARAPIQTSSSYNYSQVIGSGLFMNIGHEGTDYRGIMPATNNHHLRT